MLLYVTKDGIIYFTKPRPHDILLHQVRDPPIFINTMEVKIRKAYDGYQSGGEKAF